MRMMDELLTVADVARELGITQVTVRRYCLEGRLGRKVGRQWLVTRQQLDAFKAQRRPPGRPRKEEG